MSYYFQPISTHFAVRGTILSYFSGSSRTDSNDGTDCLGRPASRGHWLARPTSVRQIFRRMFLTTIDTGVRRSICSLETFERDGHSVPLASPLPRFQPTKKRGLAVSNAATNPDRRVGARSARKIRVVLKGSVGRLLRLPRLPARRAFKMRISSSRILRAGGGTGTTLISSGILHEVGGASST